MENKKLKLNLGPRTKKHLFDNNLPDTIELGDYYINDLRGKLPPKSLKEIKDQLENKGLKFKA